MNIDKEIDKRVKFAQREYRMTAKEAKEYKEYLIGYIFDSLYEFEKEYFRN